MKKYYDDNEAHISNYKSNWRRENKDRLNARQKERLQTEPNFRLAHCLRSRINKLVDKDVKSGSAVRDLGCSVKQFKAYLESKFLEGMTWNNHTTDGWHIDHIIPLSSFDLSDPEQFKQACHYTNLQPLWAKDNMSKGNRI